jgi:ABC-2 type transport system permease protein
MKSLLKLKYRQLRNALVRGEKKKFILFLLLGLFFIFVLGFFFNKIFAYLVQVKEFPDFFKVFLAEKLLMMIFMTLFSMLLLSALLTSLDVFFISRDLHFLFSTPMPVRSAFTWKMLEVSAYSSAMVVFFSLPVLFFYCRYFAPGIGQGLQVLLAFFLFIAAGVLTGVLLGLVIPAFFSVRRLQPVLSVFSIILISGIVVFLRLLRPERFLEPSEIDNVLRYMGSLDVKIFSYFPFAWLARAMSLAGGGKSAPYWRIIGLFVVLAGSLLALVFWIRKKLYLQLFDKLNRGGRGYFKSNWHPSRLKNDGLPLLRKEWKTFLRTPAQWSQLLIVGALVAVFVINMKMIPLPHPSVKNFVSYLNLVMALFIVAGLNSRFTFTSIPGEGPGLAHIFSSPFVKLKFYRFKFFFHLAPQLLIGFTLYAVGDLALHFDAFTRIIALVFLTPAIVFLTVFSLVLGIETNESNPLSPEHVIVSKQGISYMLWSMIYLVAGMIFLVRPVGVYYWHHFTHAAIPYGEITAWFFGFELINLALISFYYRRGKRLWLAREL